MAQLVRDVMSRKVLFVTPSASIRTAMELLRGQQLEALPVMDGGRLVGIVETLDLYRFNGEFPVTEAMSPARAEVTIAPDASVVEGASTMLRHGLRQLPVVCNGQLVGLLSDRDLAASWGSVLDPLTGLPWQDEMRRWAARQLAAGREITIVFLDLNNFGAFNKARGHVYGDRILQTVAQVCRAATDPERDCLCRYGGDEFVAASTRSAEGARALAVTLRDAIRALTLEDRPVGIGAAIGIAGGQRHVPRPDAHPYATLDDLLTLASQASTRAKELPESILAAESQHGRMPFVGRRFLPDEPSSWDGYERVAVDGYTISRRRQEVAVTVGLRAGGRLQEATNVRGPHEIELALALATADCLAGFLPPQIHLRVEKAAHWTIDGQYSLISVVVTWRDPEGEEEQLVGASLTRTDAYRAVINALLDATNRRLGPWVARALPSGSERKREA
ncbi:MAG: GGDEF domain-containing protein [Armatimonadetes bacterium]|nr:GGDEF domain-containing protein [Armatimonadota bacterium]